MVQAIACYRKALSLRPEFPDAFANLVHSLVFVCDWSNRDADFAALKQMLAAQVRTPIHGRRDRRRGGVESGFDVTGWLWGVDRVRG